MTRPALPADEPAADPADNVGNVVELADRRADAPVELARTLVGVRGAHRSVVVATAGPVGTTRWRAECTCSWSAAVSRSNRAPAERDASEHLRTATVAR